MRYTWSEKKRASNLKKHALDFEDAPRVFEGLTVTIEDDRYDYAETRFVTLGWLEFLVVSIVHTEAADEIRIISFRKATKREQDIYFASIQD